MYRINGLINPTIINRFKSNNVTDPLTFFIIKKK